MRQCPKCHKRFLEASARVCDADGAVLDLVVMASDRDRLVGTTINNRYVVDKMIGDGGMGVVYRAYHIENQSRFAVKVLRAEYSEEEDLVLRFEQEARAAAAINNPHIVEIYDWGSLPDNSRFFVMEYLEGRSLGDLMSRMPKSPGSDRRQPLPEDFALNISMQIADGLRAAHEIGIVHRDIKPDNFHIIRRPDDPYFVKILDFGIAKVQNSKAAKTRTGSVFGTPHYMSPEQASGDKNIDDKTDIYGLGVMMYEMVVGKIPFDAENLMGILTAHLYHTPTPPSIYPECEKLSKSFEAVILRCLAKDKEARYGSMRELNEDLARCRRGDMSEALEDQEVNTRKFDRSDFALDAATVIRQLPSALMPASPEEVNAALGLQGQPNSGSHPAAQLTALSGSPPPQTPVQGSFQGQPQTYKGVASQAPPMHSMSLPAPPPPSQMSNSAPPSPFDAVGPIRFAEVPNAYDSRNPTSLPPGTEVQRPKSKTGLIVGMILGLGVVIAVAIVMIASARPADSQPTDPTLAVTQQLQPGRVMPDTDASTLHQVPDAQSQPVILQSTVPGARVYRAGVVLGDMPYTVARPSVGEETYNIVAVGYQEQSVVVTSVTASPMVVTLTPVGASTPIEAPGTDNRHDRPHGPRRPGHVVPVPNVRPRQPPNNQRRNDLHDPWNLRCPRRQLLSTPNRTPPEPLGRDPGGVSCDPNEI
jgi:serine/threonine protein kinase